MRRRTLLALAATATLGCVAAPLGDDWDDLGGAARDQRAVDVLSGLFAARVDGAGGTEPDRAVLLADLDGISYEVDGRTSHLRWRDVEAVEQDDHPELPARPVDLRLYLRHGSPSEEGIPDLVEPTFASTGLFRRYVMLRMRPRGSRAKLLAALDHVRRRAAERGEAASRAPRASPAPVDSAALAPVPTTTVTAPVDTPDRLDDVETTLRRLKAWRDEGLITEEEYQAKREALLEGL